MIEWFVKKWQLKGIPTFLSHLSFCGRSLSLLEGPFNERLRPDHTVRYFRIANFFLSHWLVRLLISIAGVGLGHGFPITTVPILGTDLCPKDRSPCNGKSSEQECIPVGCVPSAAVTVGGGGVVCPGGCLPRGGSASGCIPPHLWTESQTGVKTLPFRNFVCGRW